MNGIRQCGVAIASATTVSLRPRRVQPHMRPELTRCNDGVQPGYRSMKDSDCINMPQLSFCVQHVGFGKHGDLTLGELYKKEPSYIQWLRRQPDPSEGAVNVLRHVELMDMVNDVPPVPHTVDEAPHHPKHRQLLDFSKYKGLSFKQVYEEHNDFIEWLQHVSEDGNVSPQAEPLLIYAEYMDGILSDADKMERLRDSKVGFGKHSELTVGELYSQHYDYVCFLRRGQQPCSAAAKRVLRYAEYMDNGDSGKDHDQLRSTKETHRLGDSTVSIGQHSGKTFS